MILARASLLSCDVFFIVFDFEIAFFSWALTPGYIGLWSTMVFLGVLTVGFVYEWNKGALDWE